MKLSDLDLLKLIPIFMREDETVGALASVVNEYTQRVSRELPLLHKWDQIDRMDDQQLDALAWELNVLWYDSGAPLETKRRLIKKSDIVYSRLGTKWAVEEVVSAYFHDSKVLEWFEYGGKPNYFKIVYRDKLTTETKSIFIRSLETVKRKSQWLQTFVIENLTITSGWNLFYLKHLSIKSHFNNYFVRPVRFTGSARWDGSINFDQQITGRFHMKAFTVRQRFITGETFHLRACFPTLVVNRESSAVAQRFHYQIPNKEALQSMPVTVQCAVENSNSSRIFLKTNTMYAFNGGYRFDGTRRFNAAVTEEEI